MYETFSNLKNLVKPIQIKNFIPQYLPTYSPGMFSSKNSYYMGEPRDHFVNDRFRNLEGETQNLSFKAFKWFLTNKRPVWQEVIGLVTAKPAEKVMGEELKVTNVGHATFLIQTEGLNILTDPIWSERCSPFSWLGPKRVISPGIEFEDLPKIDIVWISHNHYDHLDEATISRLHERFQPRFITPLGNDTIIRGINPSINCEAYDLYDRVKLTDDISIYLSPMLHWSARGIFDRNMALWAAVTFETPHGDIYFVGDTAYGSGQNFVNAKSKTLRLAILPMGAYEPRWFMKHAHMCPSEFYKAHHILEKPFTIPTHYDVFPLAFEPQGESLQILTQAIENETEEKSNICILGVGKTTDVPSLH